MIDKQNANPYFAFRFIMIADSTGEAMDAAQMYHDPFIRGMWIGRGHLVERPPMAPMLAEEKKLAVYLLTRGNIFARKIVVEYEGTDWFPLDVDATNSSVAMEWVLLKNAKYTGWEDLQFDRMGHELREKLWVGPAISSR